MRAWVALVLAGCGHAAVVSTVDTARVLEIGWKGDRWHKPRTVAWSSFVMATKCSSVEIESHGAPIEVIEPDGTRVTKPRIENAPLGHYYVHAEAPIRVVDARTGFECGDVVPPSPILQTQAPRGLALPTAPPGMIVAPILVWSGWGDSDAPSYVAEIGAGLDAGIDVGTARLIDLTGEVVPDATLRLEGADLHTASGRLVGDRAIVTRAWAIAYPRPPVPPPPLDARITDRWRGADDVYIRFDRGWTDGIAVGWHGAIGISTAEVVQVLGHRGIARVAATLAQILTAERIALRP